jgi:urate oxidase
MRARLGDNQYGKAEIRVMKVDRDRPRHVLHDLTVTVALAGDMDEVHLVGDNSAVLPTDTQKNTVFAFAREHGVDQVEDFAVLLARHFVDTQQAVHRATVTVVEHQWERLADHSFARAGRETRTTTVTPPTATRRSPRPTTASCAPRSTPGGGTPSRRATGRRRTTRSGRR